MAALEALLALRDLAGERVDVSLLSPRPELEYRPLAVAEPFGITRSRSYELEPIARDQSAELRKGGLAEVHAGDHQVITHDGRDARLRRAARGRRREGPASGCLARSRSRAPATRQRFRALLEEIDDGRIHRLTFAVPPGVAWPIPLYELALLTATHAASAGRDDLEISLVTPEAEPLELFGAKASAATRALLEERGIDL